MCQAFIGKISFSEKRADSVQLSRSGFSGRYSKAHRRAAVLALQSFRSEVVAGASQHRTTQLNQPGACSGSTIRSVLRMAIPELLTAKANVDRILGIEKTEPTHEKEKQTDAR